MNSIIEINRQRTFSLEEARNLLPLVYRLTDESSREVRRLVQCLEALPDKKGDRGQELQVRIDACIDRWQRKVERLGVMPKGLWLADFDKGDGYWCWKFPETEIGHYHGYQDGFSGRKVISPMPGEC